MTQKTHPTAQDTESSADRLATVSELCQKVISALRDPEFSVNRLIGAIVADPSLTAALAQLAGLQRTALRDLDGRTMFESETYGSSLGATLEEAIQRGVALERIDLRGADLRGVRIVAPNARGWVYMDGADLSGADLRGARITRANLVGADLSDAQMSGASLHSVNAMDAVLERVDLSGADLRFVGMNGVRAVDADLSGCFMDTVGFGGASLVRAKLSRSRMVHFDHTGGFNRANLSYADLGGVQAEGPVPFIQASLLHADLSGATLPGAIFIESTLRLCTMVSADLTAARFERACCEGVDAVAVDLRRASMVDANFDRARLDGADLRGARIRRISTDRAVVEGIRLDDEDAYHFAVPARQTPRPRDKTLAEALILTRHLQRRAPDRPAQGALAG